MLARLRFVSWVEFRTLHQSLFRRRRIGVHRPPCVFGTLVKDRGLVAYGMDDSVQVTLDEGFVYLGIGVYTNDFSSARER